MDMKINLQEAMDQIVVLSNLMAEAARRLNAGTLDPIEGADYLDRMGRELRDISTTICEMTYWLKKMAKKEHIPAIGKAS